MSLSTNLIHTGDGQFAKKLKDYASVPESLPVYLTSVFAFDDVPSVDAIYEHEAEGYMNHTLLTKAYGPRVRLVSVITDAPLPPDPMIDGDICIRCGACARRCPMQAFTPREDRLIADMDKHKCAAYHQKLKNEFRYPCGLCTSVCPVGEDRKLYGMRSVSPEGVAHCQNFGSRNAVENM